MEVAFVVEGEAIVRIARNRAWMDDERAHAIRILGCLAHETHPESGLSGEAIDKILDGEATLSGDSTKGINFVERSDSEWKRVVEKRRDFFAIRAMERAEELIERRQAIEFPDSHFAGVRAFVSAFAPGDVDVMPAEEKQTVVGKGKAVRVGGRKVPKHLIEQYVLVVTRLKAGAFLGVSGAFAHDPLAFMKLEERRVAIHDEIMGFLGLDRESEQGEAFTLALHEKYGLFAKGDDS